MRVKYVVDGAAYYLNMHVNNKTSNKNDSNRLLLTVLTKLLGKLDKFDKLDLLSLLENLNMNGNNIDLDNIVDQYYNMVR